MKIVDPNIPPEPYKKLNCPEHGELDWTIRSDFGLRRDEGGRIIKDKVSFRQICPHCFLEGKFTEVGR